MNYEVIHIFNTFRSKIKYNDCVHIHIFVIKVVSTRKYKLQLEEVQVCIRFVFGSISMFIQE